MARGRLPLFLAAAAACLCLGESLRQRFHGHATDNSAALQDGREGHLAPPPPPSPPLHTVTAIRDAPLQNVTAALGSDATPSPLRLPLHQQQTQKEQPTRTQLLSRRLSAPTAAPATTMRHCFPTAAERAAESRESLASVAHWPPRSDVCAGVGPGCRDLTRGCQGSARAHTRPVAAP